jgi:HTH-type transcriptional regulator / antitoxin HigA
MNNKDKNEFDPDYVIHPGEILEETLQARGIGKSELALRSGLTTKTISQIVNGKAPITPETAVRLERILDVKATIWLKLDADNRLFIQKQQEKKLLEKKFTWIQSFPIRELIARRLLPKTKEKSVLVSSLLDFFNVGTIDAWEKQYSKMAIQFRKTGKNKPNSGAIAAWLKIGESKAKEIAVSVFNKSLFEKTLTKIRPLTIEAPEKFEPEMIKLCAESGVAVVLVKEFPGTGISGATYWLGKNKVILMLSLRYKSDDHFWFTFFHEAGHILLHSESSLIVDGNELSGCQVEDEANAFAADFLIPKNAYCNFIMNNPRIDDIAIRRFAEMERIAPGIIVGRMQKEGRLKFSWRNNLKRRFELKE